MEGHANSVEDRLIDGLSFKLAPGASYVQERKSVTFHPSGSNSYSSAGTKLIKLHITGDGWLDVSTFRVMFDLLNDDNTTTKLLRPLGGAWCFFRRMRVLAGNQVIEDIDNYMYAIRRNFDFHFFINAKSAENPYYKLDALVWSSIFHEKVPRYSE